MSGKNDFHKLRISTGQENRGRVKNITITWRKFCRKFERPSVDEGLTFAQYLKLSVDEQGVRKAAPGFIVGAHFKDGKRRLVNMLKRTLLSFDLDAVTPAQVGEIEMGLSPICDYEFLRHTTRKHCPESPRWRIHMPLSRPVDHDEANALTRILAARLFADPQASIDAVDVVSHRFAQVSYMPSRSRDQEYRCERNEGEILDVDAMLESFEGDWRDHTQLPMRSDEKTARGADPNRKMEDPREKPGIIGAWCRTYTVDEVIAKFLADIYESGVSTDGHPRYTYVPGTAANGAVSYDDGLFLYSHHGSDPIEGAANAWDLMRIHKFGHLDESVREGTSPGKLPSYRAMVEFAGRDPAVKEALLEGRRASFDDDTENTAGRFDDDEPGEGEVREIVRDSNKPSKKSWRTALVVHPETGAVAKTVHNVNLIFQHDPIFKGTISYNLFTRKIVTRKLVDFPGLDLSRVPIEDHFNGREWLDADEYDRKLILAAPEEQGGYGLDASVLDITAAVETAARCNSFHPVIDRLESLEWDGIERVETFFIDYLGVEDNAYHREAALAWFTAAVARIFEPGCKFDHVPIIGGAQGIGKSSLIRILSMGYFGELPGAFDRLQVMVEAMSGVWMAEMAELAGFRKAEVESLKHFISSQADRVRLAYRRNEETFRRQCVFMGTTNQEEYLKDDTGNRRFWPIKAKVERIDLDRLRRERDMILAEALTLYRERRREQPKGELYFGLVSEAAKQTALDLQEESRTTLPWELMRDRIKEWLETPVSRAVVEAGAADTFDDDEGEQLGLRTRVTLEEAWHVGLGKTVDPSPVDLQNLNKAFRNIEGWSYGRHRVGGKQARILKREGSNWRRKAWEPR